MTAPLSRAPAIETVAPEGPTIEFDHATFCLNGCPLLQDLVLSVNQGETLVLLGRSGSGKTTTLKLINRLLLPTAGDVRVNGRPTAEWDPIRLRRSIGYVIQDGGLFPHFTVERNIALHGEMREQTSVLDDVSDASTQTDRIPFRSRASIHAHVARGRQQQPIDQLQGGCLP